MITRRKSTTYKRDTSTLFDHSMELAGTVNGVDYINDSQSIRLQNTWESLHSLETDSKNILLILGGADRGSDYTLLKELVAAKAKGVICLSPDSNEMYGIFRRDAMFFAHAISIDEAVAVAAAYARSGDIVLFSPGCPSYDAFDNYRNRGDQFKKSVRKIIREK